MAMAEKLKCMLRRFFRTIRGWAGIAVAAVRSRPGWSAGGAVFAGILLVLLAAQSRTGSRPEESVGSAVDLEAFVAPEASSETRDGVEAVTAKPGRGGPNEASNRLGSDSWTRRRDRETAAAGEAAGLGTVRHAAAWLERSNFRSGDRTGTIRTTAFESQPTTRSDDAESPRGAWLAGYIEPLPDEHSRR